MDAFKTLEVKLKKLPFNLKVAIGASLVIGLLGHMFCFTNTLFLHDAAGVYWDSVSFADAASGSRWLYPIYDYFLSGVQLPWFDGMLTLLLYGISAWLVCEILNIKRTMAVIVVTGLMVLSPTAIASNCYLSSAPIYASALLFACLAVYAFYNWKWGALWFVVFALISEGSYAAYIGFSICLFFLRSIMTILENDKDGDKKLFKQHWSVLAGVVASLGVTFLVMKLLQIGSDAALQARVSEVTQSGITVYLKNAYETVYTVARTFLPGGYISYMQARTVTYAIFLLGMAITCFMYLKVFVGRKIWKRTLAVVLLLADVAFLPFAMNFLRLITEAHTLMQFGFIVPWIFAVQMHEKMLDVCVSNADENKRIMNIYSWIIVVFSITSLVNFGVLANTTYTKEAVLYEAGTSLTNRIVERIESMEEYGQDETPVVFIGSTRRYYAPYHSGFEICDDITGIGTPWWDTSLTYNFPLISYIKQHLGIEMEILNNIGTTGMNLEQLQSILEEQGYVIGYEELEQKIEQMEAFPSEECGTFMGDILVFKLGDQD